MAGADAGLDRRTFMRVIGCGGCALAVATTTSCTIAEVFGVEAGGQLAFDVAEPQFAALANVGGSVAVDVAGRPMLLIRAGSDRLVALNRICTHTSCDMNPDGGQGRWDGSKLICTCHDSHFDADGKVLQGPATRDLTAYDVQFDASTGRGTVTVGDTPEPEPENPVPEPYRDLQSPFARDDADALAAGELIWNDKGCGNCHGANGEGGPSFMPPATAFANGTDSVPDDYYFWRLRTGNATGPDGSIMPAYPEDQLSDEQLWQVITYLRSLGQ